jgi:hypothetical protein
MHPFAGGASTSRDDCESILCALVRAPDGSWSASIPINDARPLWATPDSAYSTAAFAGLPRALKVVGRNLQPGPGTAAATQVRLVGAATGTTYTLTAKNSANDSANTTAALERYVTEVSLPATLTSPTNGSGVAATDVGTPFTIGNRALGKARNFNGSLDGVRVYNRQLSQTEIQALVSAGL